MSGGEQAQGWSAGTDPGKPWWSSPPPLSAAQTHTHNVLFIQSARCLKFEGVKPGMSLNLMYQNLHMSPVVAITWRGHGSPACCIQKPSQSSHGITSKNRLVVIWWFYLVQSRSQYRHQEAIVDVAEQLRPDGGMSNLKKTSADGRRVGCGAAYCMCCGVWV